MLFNSHIAKLRHIFLEISVMIHYKLFLFVYVDYFLYLCTIVIKIDRNMVKASKTFGRTELALVYFPQLCPEAAWHKLRSWLKLNPRLQHLYELRRRSFTPAEVQLIYAELGEP